MSPADSPPQNHPRDLLSRDALLGKTYELFGAQVSGLAAGLKDCREQRTLKDARISKLETMNLRLMLLLMLAGGYSVQDLIRVGLLGG